MLIRNAKRSDSPDELTDVRLMHGCVQEIGVGLAKGLYEAEIDLGGDVLSPGLMLDAHHCADTEAELRALCRQLYRQGVRCFTADVPEEVLHAVQEHPARKGALPVRALPVQALPEQEHLRVGTPAPLIRRNVQGKFVSWIDAHSGD